MNDGGVSRRPCLSCDVVAGRRSTVGGAIVETRFFHAHQDIAYPIPGLVIVASKRHVFCLDELTTDEASDYIALLQRVRKAQREVLGIAHVYYFYNEDTTHHFHTWMLPRYAWMNEFGRSIESVRPVLVHARHYLNDEENIARVEQSVRELRRALDGEE